MNHQYQQHFEFYTQARKNKQLAIDTDNFGSKYDRERCIAFVDWCDFILEELEKQDKDNFVAEAFTAKYGKFQYPSEEEWQS